MKKILPIENALKFTSLLTSIQELDFLYLVPLIERGNFNSNFWSPLGNLLIVFSTLKEYYLQTKEQSPRQYIIDSVSNRVAL